MTTTTVDDVVAQRRAEIAERGFTIIEGAIDPDRLARGRTAIDHLIASGIAPDRGQTFHAPNLVARDPVFLEIAMLPALCELAEALLGDDCILSSCNLGARKPDVEGSAAGNLHRDTGIWGPSMPLLDLIVGMQTVWCFDDWSVTTGATRITPGSHRDPGARADGPAIDVEAPAGSVIAFDCSAFHGAGCNRSGRVRRGVLTLYIRSWLKPQTDHKRSYPRERISALSETEARLLGFQRQSPVEHPDGRSEVVLGPGATAFYGQPVGRQGAY